MEESDADGEGDVEDGVDEAQKIRKDMKLGEYGSGGGGGGGGGIERVKLSTDVNGGGEAGGGRAGGRFRSKTLVRLRDV